MRIVLVAFSVMLVVLAATGLAILRDGGVLSGAVTVGVVVWLLPGVFLGFIVAGGGRRGWDGVRSIRLRRDTAVVFPFLKTSKYLWLIFAVFPLAGLFSRLVRKRGLLGVAVSQAGVYHLSWFGCCFYAWEWITEVRPAIHRRSLIIDLVVAEPEHSWDPEENLVARFDSFRESMQRIQLGHLAVNPAVPLYAIEFYRRHPELRHELGTDKGVERIRNGDLPDVLLEVYNNGRFLPATNAGE